MSDSDLTWDRVCNTATAMEMAAKDAVEMVAENTTEQSPSSTDLHWQSHSAASRRSSQCGMHWPRLRQHDKDLGETD
ncbi:hypothetical protein MTO96_016301 [Rhipicephalus appendiculatus]